MLSNKGFKLPVKRSLNRIQNSRKPTVSLTNAEYNEIFEAVINPVPTKITSNVKSPVIAISPNKWTAKSSKENTAIDIVRKAMCFVPNKKIEELQPYQEVLKKMDNVSFSHNRALNISIVKIKNSPRSELSETRAKRQRLEWIQETRGTKGLWVKCDNKECGKWRWLNIADPTELSDNWYCRMNPDKAFNSCTFPERHLIDKEDTLIRNCYTAGSIVWAKMIGYPWWPAMVDDDPDNEQFYWMDDEKSDIPDWYHVIFFDDNEVNRAWVRVKQLRTCKYKDLRKKISNTTLFHDRLEISRRHALDARKLNIKERLKKYSFLALWDQQIPEGDLDKEVNQDNRNINKKRKNSIDTINENNKKRKCNSELFDSTIIISDDESDQLNVHENEKLVYKNISIKQPQKENNVIEKQKIESKIKHTTTESVILLKRCI